MTNRKMLIKKSCRKCGVIVMIKKGKYGNPPSPLCSKCKANPHKEIIKLKEKQNVLN